ncbi:MAG TPA: hypothetical protein VER03_10210 [Bryobacteraceae bacterium]|nr:hypothetical protein [Bryobacteraceae bacterium]
MRRRQFRVLYRQFLFRLVDVEILSAHGDSYQLMGRVAALLGFLSMILAMGAILFDPTRLTAEALQSARWAAEHRLIAMTMLIAGMVAVLSWDGIYPDRRDVLVIAPLPVHPGTIFLAKLAASGTVLAVAVAGINVFTGFSWPFVLIAESSGWFGWLRSLTAYWLTMALAAGFVFVAVLAIQGMLAQALPYRYFVRVSSFLQLAAFAAWVSLYLLQPSLSTPAALALAEGRGVLAWLPAYWFLGLFQDLNGSPDPAMAILARRAWIAIASATAAAALAFLVSYYRTVRKIVEEPDIAPGYGLIQWSPILGKPLRTAVLLFTVRTLFRSRQHRLLLAFYLGFALAITVAYLKTPLALRQLSAGTEVNVPAMVSTIVVLCAAIVGTRVVFDLPLMLRANWIFRVTESHGPDAYQSAVRCSLLTIAALPVCAVSTIAFAYVWPWPPVIGHAVVLLLLSLILVELCLHGFHKLPFTCSYLPGKSNIQIAFGLSVMGLMAVTHSVATIERRALQDPARFAVMFAVLGLALAVARWRVTPAAQVQFDDEPPAALCGLNLSKDGVPIR